MGNQEFKMLFSPSLCFFWEKTQPNTNKPKADVAWALRMEQESHEWSRR